MKRTKELEARIAELEEQLSRSITWSVDDFEGQALEKERRSGGIQLYDRSKFEDALSDMIRKHDAELGISWTTVDCYLYECAYSEQGLIARELTKLTGIEGIYDWNETADDQVELYDKDDNEIGKTTSEVLTKAMNRCLSPQKGWTNLQKQIRTINLREKSYETKTQLLS